MKKSSTFLVLPIVVFVSLSCSSLKKTEGTGSIRSLAGRETITDGNLVYSLPRTAITVFVEMNRTIEIPGPYAQNAADLLGLTNVIKKESESWTIESIKVKASSEMDPSELYVIEGSSLLAGSALALKKEGLILDPGHSDSNQGSGLHGEAIKKAGRPEFTDLGSDEYFLLQSDTAFKRISVDSSFIRIPYVVDKKRRLTTDQLAEKAAKRLLELRDGKHMILTGEATVYPQNDAAINEMNKMEKEYTELFAGKRIRESRIFTFQIIPDKNISSKQSELFRFSESKGAMPVNQPGTPVSVKFVPEQKTKELTMIRTVPSDPKAPQYDKLYYRIPDVADMTLYLGDEALYSSRVIVYQFGEVVQLPSNYVIGK